MGVTAPDQDVSSTQKYFTPPFGKGTPTHSPGGAFMFPPPDLAHTVHFSPSPPQVHPSIHQGSVPPFPGIFQKCSLLWTVRGHWVYSFLRSLTTHCLCAHVICQRLQSAGSKGLVLSIFAGPQDAPTPAHHQHRATHKTHLTKWMTEASGGRDKGHAQGEESRFQSSRLKTLDGDARFIFPDSERLCPVPTGCE